MKKHTASIKTYRGALGVTWVTPAGWNNWLRNFRLQNISKLSAWIMHIPSGNGQLMCNYPWRFIISQMKQNSTLENKVIVKHGRELLQKFYQIQKQYEPNVIKTHGTHLRGQTTGNFGSLSVQYSTSSTFQTTMNGLKQMIRTDQIRWKPTNCSPDIYNFVHFMNVNTIILKNSDSLINLLQINDHDQSIRVHSLTSNSVL